MTVGDANISVTVNNPGSGYKVGEQITILGSLLGGTDGADDIVVNGKAGSAMQAFAAQLNPAEIAAVVTYERNAWGNDVGDLVQPREVNALVSGEE